MDLLSLAVFLLLAGWMLKTAQQRRRVALLAGFLGRYQIERKMETVTQGYLRALNESDPSRSAHLWEMLRATEQDLCAQFTRFAADFARADPASSRVSRLPLWVPFALTLFPTMSFDMRAVLAVHARGICSAVEAEAATSPRDRAFTISAELFLMQHSCHWFCKSRLVASARMLARHKTSYAQLLASVGSCKRAEYGALVGQG